MGVKKDQKDQGDRDSAAYPSADERVIAAGVAGADDPRCVSARRLVICGQAQG